MLDDDQTTARLTALETQGRRLRWLLAVFAILLVALTLAVVESYREMDDLGRYGLNTTSLGIMDPSGRRLASLGRQHPDGRPYLKFVDEGEHFRVLMALRAQGPSLELQDSRGRVRLRLAAGDGGGVIELLDADGGVVWSAP
jgi:hypothetical protein